MAQGDVTTFQEFRQTIADGTHDLDTHSFKLALVTATSAPTAADASPVWTSGYDANEVTGGTSYTAGGEALTTAWDQVSGTGTFETTAPVTWTQDASGPTDISYGVIYNDTASGKPAIAFIDMRSGGTTPISLQDGDITVAADTVFTLT